MVKKYVRVRHQMSPNILKLPALESQKHITGQTNFLFDKFHCGQTRSKKGDILVTFYMLNKLSRLLIFEQNIWSSKPHCI